MLDITLCYGLECLQKYECYRHTAVHYGRQDFFGSPPFDKKTNSCELLMSNKHQIEQIAYFIWIDEGKPNNCETIHWQKAIKKLIETTK